MNRLAALFIILFCVVLSVSLLGGWFWYGKILWLGVFPGTFIIAIVTAFALYFSYRSVEQSTAAFLQKMMLGIFLKLFISLIFFLISLKFLPIAKGMLIGSYFFAYFSFTFFEVWALLNKLRSN
jgi:hypothetical protein